MTNLRRIYLDHAAATPLDSRVFTVMKHLMAKEFGNPGALYREGVAAKDVILLARKKKVQKIKCILSPAQLNIRQCFQCAKLLKITMLMFPTSEWTAMGSLSSMN